MLMSEQYDGALCEVFNTSPNECRHIVPNMPSPMPSKSQHDGPVFGVSSIIRRDLNYTW